VKNFIPETAMATIGEKKVFVEILGMGDRAPLLAHPSRGTPPKPSHSVGGGSGCEWEGMELVGRGPDLF